jgi:hypothetical protein
LEVAFFTADAAFLNTEAAREGTAFFGGAGFLAVAMFSVPLFASDVAQKFGWSLTVHPNGVLRAQSRRDTR